MTVMGLYMLIVSRNHNMPSIMYVPLICKAFMLWCCFIKRPVCPGAKAPQSLMQGHLDGFGMLLGETSGVRPPPFPPLQMCVCVLMYTYQYENFMLSSAKRCLSRKIMQTWGHLIHFYQLLRVFMNSYLFKPL